MVSAGVKSILDIGATLERLETLSVAVVGYRTNTFPAFWLRESAFSLEWRVEEASEIAAIMGARDDLDQQGGILVANPVPQHQQWDPSVHDEILVSALTAGPDKGIHGKAVRLLFLAYF